MTTGSMNAPAGSSALLKQNADRAYPIVTHGKGVYLYDSTGKRYLDGSSGAMTASIGHGSTDVADAIAAQARQIAFAYRTQFTNEPAEELARRLTQIAPGDLDYAFFVNSGSEATEFAIRAAVGHWRSLGRPAKAKILGGQISYHGMTMGALSLSGHSARRPDYGPLLHPFAITPPVSFPRYARQGEAEQEYAARAAAELESAILAEDPETVAAVIVEPIVGAAGGVLVPPPGYLTLLRSVCDRLDVLLIADEVITGAGRTGEWYACTTEGVVPDLLLVGKGISGGFAPVAGVLLRTHLVDAVHRSGGLAPFGHTFSANPLGAATCLAVLDVLERDGVLENVRARGVQLEAGLQSLAARHRHIAEIRGRGLLWGFDLVDPLTKRPPAPQHSAATTFTDECFAQGLIVYPAGISPLNNAVMICPPLVITEPETAELLDRLDAALQAASGGNLHTTSGASTAVVTQPPR